MTRGNIAYKERYLARVLERASPTNRPEIQRCIDSKRAQGLTLSTLVNLAGALVQLDQYVGARPLADLSREDLTAALATYAATHSKSSATNWAQRVKSYYSWLHDGEAPRAVKNALKRKARDDPFDTPIITEEELRKLLVAAGETPDRRIATRNQALIWALWDSGFRISELLALRVQDFVPDGRGGAELRIPPKAPNLKTGPRTIYVVECIGGLTVWLALHPRGREPDAPLFGTVRDPHAWPSAVNVNNMLNRLCTKAGLRHIHPHLFRHTRATRVAIKGWNEPQMRAYFGWSAGSSMAARYIHLSQRNMEARVRADAGLDP